MEPPPPPRPLESLSGRSSDAKNAASTTKILPKVAT